MTALAKPGNNLTGFANFEAPIGGKWLCQINLRTSIHQDVESGDGAMQRHLSQPGRGALPRSPLLSTLRCAWMTPGRGSNHEIDVTAVGVDCTCARASRDRLCRDATCRDPAGHRLVELGLKAKGK
jgi:hypothetical protein